MFERLMRGRSDLARRFAAGVSWNLISVVVGRAFGVVGSVVVARLLGKEAFGRLGVIQNTVATFGFIAAVTMSVTSTKFIAQFRNLDTARAGRLMGLCWSVALAFGVVAMTLVYVFAPRLSETLYNAPELSGMLRWGSLFIVFSSLAGTQTGMLTGLEMFRKLAVLTLVFGFVNFAVTVPLTWLRSLEGAVIALVAVQVLNWMVNSLVLRDALRRFSIRPSLVNCWQEREILISFSLPHALAGLLNMPLIWISNAMLARRHDGMSEMGLFSAAYRWRELVLFLPSALSAVAAAMHAERLGCDDHRAVRKVLWASLVLVAVSGLVAVAVIGIGARWILSQHGPGFVENGVPVMLILVTEAFVQCLAIPFSNLTTSAGKTWPALTVGIARGAILVLATYSLVGSGARGLALANLLAALVSLAGMLAIAMRILRDGNLRKS